MAKNNDSALAIELSPGANIYINCEPEEPKAPKGFVDSTVKLGRLQPDGSIEWYGTQDPFPEGCDDLQRNIKRWAKREEGEDTVAAPSKKPSKEILEQIFEEAGYVIARAASIYSDRYEVVTDVSFRRWLMVDGIIDPQPTQAKSKYRPEPRKAAVINQEFEDALPRKPVLEPGEQKEADIIQNLRSQYEPSDNDWQAEDDEPIPFVLVEQLSREDRINKYVGAAKMQMINHFSDLTDCEELTMADREAIISSIMGWRVPA